MGALKGHHAAYLSLYDKLAKSAHKKSVQTIMKQNATHLQVMIKFEVEWEPLAFFNHFLTTF
jgi:hypothetical protein